MRRCFALPFLLGSLRIFSSGAAIAGWSGLSDIGRSKNLIVTDRDLFPEGSVELENVRIFADGDPERIISFAGSMICAAGCSVSEVFGKLMEDNGYTTCRIDNFEYLSGGGMKGIIDGSVVICGSTELMRLMNVRVPYRLVGKTSVLHPAASGAAGADKSHPLRPTPDICDTRLQYQPRNAGEDL